MSHLYLPIRQSLAVLALGIIPVLCLGADRAWAQSLPEVVPHVVVVQFEAGVSLSGKTATTGLQIFDRNAAVYGVHTIERMFPFLDHVEPTPKTRRNLLALRRTYYVRYRADMPPDRVSRDLAFAPGIVYAEPVPVNRTLGLVRRERVDPNDPRFKDQSELGLMRLPKAWDVVKSSDGVPKVVIAIVDDGTEWRHEDLRASVWTNEDEIPGNGIDDDNNGFIDDVHGVNFQNGVDTDNDPTPSPGNPHGTWVAGAASAVTDNNVGIAGAAWNAELMLINSACPGLGSFVCKGYEGILYAAVNGADIINASWGGLVRGDQRVSHLDQTLDLATDMGALVVAGAGNNNASNDLVRTYPARFPRVLSVGATEKTTRRRAGFSHYGRLVNVFAPGENILTTGTGNNYDLVSGTSFSSPLTAGLAALVKTRFPHMAPDALREHIRLTSENIDAENPDFAGQLGRGLVNALAAVQAPTLPAVRLKRWSWADHDGDRRIASGDVVTITATIANYLSDARELTVELVGAEPYSFLDITTADVGFLASGASTEVEIEIRVASDVPDNQWVRLYTHVQDGAFEDGADQLSFGVNRSLEAVHRSLSAFYTATDGDNWRRNDNWNITRVPSEEELAKWFGVSLSEGFLVGLDLWGNSLSGSIPPELGDLNQLRELSLWHNSLSGPIPPELGNLKQLQELDLWDNSLSGSIPPELGNLEQLQVLALGGNSLSGPIPPELGNLELLNVLGLARNSLTGLIPPVLGNLEQLEWLDLDQNSLTGEIPPELGNLRVLRYLFLSHNSFTGRLPRSLMQLDNLETFEFGSQDLCAPSDDEFQMWLSSIPSHWGPTCGFVDIRYDQGEAVGDLFARLPADALMATRFIIDASSGGKQWTGKMSRDDRKARIEELLLKQREERIRAIGPEKWNGLSEFVGQDDSERRSWVFWEDEQQRIRDVWEERIEVAFRDEQENAHLRVSIGDLEPARAGGERHGRTQMSSIEDLQERFKTSSADSGEVHIDRVWLAPYYFNQFSNIPLPTDAPRDFTFYIYSDREGMPGDVLFSKEIEDPRTYVRVNFTLDFFELNLLNEGIGPLPDTIHIAYGNAGTDDNLLASGVASYTEKNISHIYHQGVWQPLWDLKTIGGKSFNETVVPIRARFRIQTSLQFAQTIADQSFMQGQPVTPLVLPEATGGVPPISYSLAPALPTGLAFDALTRTVSGTPNEVTTAPVTFTYTATDAAGDQVSQQFSVEVHSPVDIQVEVLPSAFALHGNYPNPFAGSTRIVFDLPAAARVSVDVLDITGRRVRHVPARMLEAGWDRSIDVSGAGLPSGMYVYRTHVDLPEGITLQSGSFIRIR
ncbi:MAG: S8 family serine peptidase [Bacteroidota bacterium]|nr:S8 family serine peptidase [Bacteroidota bacterium]